MLLWFLVITVASYMAAWFNMDYYFLWLLRIISLQLQYNVFVWPLCIFKNVTLSIGLFLSLFWHFVRRFFILDSAMSARDMIFIFLVVSVQLLLAVSQFSSPFMKYGAILYVSVCLCNFLVVQWFSLVFYLLLNWRGNSTFDDGNRSISRKTPFEKN